MNSRIVRLVLCIGLLGIVAACQESLDQDQDQDQDQPPNKTSRQEVRLIPMKDFFKNPEQTSFQLSPDGAHLAFLMPWENRLNVHVQQIGSDEITRVTEATARDIGGFAWANNNRLVYVQDTGGDENFHAFAVGIDGGNPVELTPFDGVRAELVDDLEDDDDHMLIALNKRVPQVFDVYKVDINSGEMTLVAENPGNISTWVTDNDGRLRAATTTDGVNTTLLYRETEADAFQPILTTNFKDSVTPLFFTFDNRQLYVSSNIGRDKSAIFLFDPKTAEHGEMLFEHPEVDVAALLRSKKRQIITGVSFTTDKRAYHFFDEQRRKLQEDLEARLPGREVVITSRSRDEKRMLVRTYSDKSLGGYYFYDTESKEFLKLVDVAPWIDETEMADMKPISYTSRDGLTIHGYLTLPRGVKAENLPAVMLVHGGPWARDHWGFNSEAQFLANRGYAVLQVNFRGSVGYGREFWEKSFKRWGQEMQNDLTDGVDWLVEQGIADPKRVGIYGGSYGGYAVLAGLTFTPDVYACGIDYVGVSNLFTLLESIPPYWEPVRQMLYEMMGNPETEADLLRRVSPLFHADKIKAPLMVLQGANDVRCKKPEADQIVRALRAKGIDVPYMVKDNEGHGFHNEENRFDVYRAMEHFLAQHLGGRVEEGTSMPVMDGKVDPLPAGEGE
ncbi:S9 family peptidase [bacterium DOLZORAL124_64_63]|nr:MAG: S9 family peptidase [bacterium DOLZORAL124_64_63]